MTTHLIGLMFVGLPFVVLAIYILRTDGWRVLIAVFGITAALVTSIAIGVLLLGF